MKTFHVSHMNILIMIHKAISKIEFFVKREVCDGTVT